MAKKVQEKMLNVTDDKKNVNWNYNEVSPHTGQMVIINKSVNNKCWKGYGEKGTPLHCAAVVNWYKHNGEQDGSS